MPQKNRSPKQAKSQRSGKRNKTKRQPTPVDDRRLDQAMSFETLEPRMLLSTTPLGADDTVASATTTILWEGELVDVYAGSWIARFDSPLGTLPSAISSFAKSITATLDTPSAGTDDQAPAVEPQTTYLGESGLFGVTVDPLLSYTDVLEAVDSLDGLAYLEPDFVHTIQAFPDDPNLSSLYGLHNTGQTGGTIDADIDAPEAWDVTTGSTDVVVGVIDSGIDYRHPDLYLNVWLNQNEIPTSFYSSLIDIDSDGLITFQDLNDAANAAYVTDLNSTGYIDAGDLLVDTRWEDGIDQDSNTYIDDLVGWDWVNNDNDPFDDNDHGTHVAGTIGARGDDGVGLVGVNWTTQMMGLKFLSAGGSGSTANGISAINYATEARRDGTNIRLTNNSWGGGAFSSALGDAIELGGTEGILFVAAAGNDGTNNDTSPHYPANYTSDYILSVAATDHNDNLASFSNYGLTTVDLAAPGVATNSTVPNGGYDSFNGTSMATPHVAGVAALAWSVNPGATPLEIKQVILDAVDPIASLSSVTLSGGRLNAFNTIQALGLTVESISPGTDDVVSTPPTEFTVVFAEDFDPASVQVADFLVNGVPATGFASPDSRTIVFQYSTSPVTTEGLQSLELGADAVARLSDGLTNNPIASAFRYDAVSLSISAMSPSDGDTVVTPLGSLSLTFNEAIDASTFDVTDITLSKGTVTGLSATSATEFEIGLGGLVEEGPVDIQIAAGAVTDLFGNPSTADFNATLFVDIGIAPLPSLLEPLSPAGSLIYASQASGAISNASDYDSFTVSLDEGQTLSLMLETDADFQAGIALRDPDGNGVALDITDPVDDSGVIQTATVSTPGPYQIIVLGISGSTGEYSLDVMVNAALEEESFTAATNDVLADAQDINDSFIDLTGGASRAAVVGQGPGVDFYRLDLAADDALALIATGLDDNPPAVNLYDASGGLIAQGWDGADPAQRLITGFAAPTTDTYYISVEGTGTYSLVATRNAEFSVLASGDGNDAQDISATGIVLGAIGATPLTATIEPDDYASGTDLSNLIPGVTLSAVSSSGAMLPVFAAANTLASTGSLVFGNSSSTSWYSSLYSLRADFAQPINYVAIDMIGDDTSDPGTLQAFDASGQLLETVGKPAFTPVGDPYTLVIDRPLADIAYITAAGTSGDTVVLDNLVINGSGVSPNTYQVNANAGDVLTIQTQTPNDGPFEPVNLLDPMIELLDPSGAVVATDLDSAGDGRNAQLTYTTLTAGAYTVRLTGETEDHGAYLVHVTGSTVPAPTLSVASIDPAEGSELTESPSQITVDFSTSVLASSVDPGDLTLDGVSATSVVLLDNDTAVFDVPGVIKGSHVIELAAGSILGLNNTPLEAFTSTFNFALEPILPLGSLAYDPPLLGQISTPGEVQEFVISLDPDQTVTLVTDPDGGLDPVVELVDPSGSVIATSTPMALGDQTLIQTQATTTPGNYTVRVSGNAGTTGDFELQLLLNTAVDHERNNTPATAQDLGSAYLDLPGSGRRAAVIGEVSAVDEDFYQIDLALGDTVSVMATALSGGTIDFDLISPLGQTVASGLTGTTNVTAVIENLQVAGGVTAGQYNLRVHGAGAYSLIITENASFDLEPNNTLTQARDISLTHSALGYLSVPSGDSSDFYQFNVSAGDTLSIETFTPADGPFSFGNNLDAALELYGPDGTLLTSDTDGAADGRNALITHTAATTGLYTVQLVAQADSDGEYVLNVSGATNGVSPLAVTSITPSDAALLGATPSSITVDFNRPILLSSLQASDLTVNGIPSSLILGFTSQSVTFATPPVGEGLHTINLSAGAITDLQGTPLAEHTSQFTVDQSPPTIIAASILQGDVVPAGNVVFTAQFSETINAALLNTSDFVLTGTVAGAVAVDRFSFDDTTDTLTLEFDALPEDNYTLLLRSGDGAIEDLLGIDLDGEAHASTTVPTGDGLPGGDFVIDFEVDINQLPIATPLIPVAPSGSLVYRGHSEGVVSSATDADEFTVELDAGQLVTVLASPSAGFQATVELLDPAGVSLGTAVSSASGETAYLQTLTANDAGLYTVRVTSADGSIGAYEVSVYLNAAYEDEALGGPTNDTLGTAQDLDAAAVELATGVDRSAAIGEGPGDDYFRFALTAGQTATLVVIPIEGTDTIDFDLLDSAGNVITSGISGLGSTVVIRDFVATATDDYFIRVNATGTYTVTLTRDASFSLQLPSDDGPQDITATGAVLGQANGGSAPVAAANTIQMGLIQDTLPWSRAINTTVANDLGYDVTLIPASTIGSADLSGYDIIVMAGAQSTTTYNLMATNMASIESYVSNGGTWLVNYASSPGATILSYDLFPGDDDPTFTYVAGTDINVLSPDSGLVNGPAGVITDTSLDGGNSSNHGYASGPLPPGGNAILSTASPDQIVAYEYPFGAGTVLVHTTPVEFYNGGPHAIGSVFHPNLFAYAADVLGPSLETYTINVNSGDTLTITTTTPGDGAFEPANGLDPMIELIDPDGNVVATDSNSAPDARNASLSYTASTSGVYTIQLSAETEQGGDYFLQVLGATGGLPAFEVTAADPVDGTVLTTSPAQITLDFSDPILQSSLDASDLTVDGVAATSVTVVDHDTVSFGLPALPDGVSTITLAAGSVLDLQGTGVASFTSTLELDATGPRVVYSSLQADDVLPAGTLIYTAEFDEPLNAAALDASDVSLVGVSSGAHTPTSFSYDPVSSTLTLEYTSLPEDQFTLTLLSGDGRFEDVLGVDLDGEPLAFPLPPNVSGDGVPGGNFYVDFSTDIATTTFPESLSAIAPAGGLVYRGSAAGVLAHASDADSYTIELDAGQTVTLLVQGDPNLRSQVTLLDPSGSSLGTGAAPVIGGEAVLQTLTAATAGTYTITVDALDGTTGGFAIDLILNAAVESEEHGGPTNDTPANAQDLDPAFTSLEFGVERAAVLGRATPANGVVFSETFATTIFDPARWTTATATIDTVGTSEPSEPYAARLNGSPDGSDEFISTVIDLSGVESAEFSYYHQQRGGGEEPDSGEDLVVTYLNDLGAWIELDRQLGSTLGSSIFTQEFLSLPADALHSLFQFRISNNATIGNFDDWFVDDIQVTATTVDDVADWYSFTLDDAQTVSLAASPETNIGVVEIELYDATGTSLLATATAAANAQLIIDYVDPTADALPQTYLVRVVGSTDYNLVLVKNAGFEAESNNAPDSAQTLGASGRVLGHVGSGASALDAPAANNVVTGPLDITGTPLSLGISSDGSFVGNTTGAVHNGVEYLRFGTFLAAYTVGFNGINYTNASPSGTTAFPVTIEDFSTPGQYQFRITGTVGGALGYERIVTWADGDDHAVITTTLENQTGATINNVALLENVDPDPGSTTTTVNDVVDTTQLGIASNVNGAMALGAIDPRAIVSIESFFVTDPFSIINSPVDPNGGSADEAINMAFDIGSLAPGESTSMNFAMIFGATPADVQSTFEAITFPTGAFGNGDLYRFDLAGGDVLTLRTATPGDGPLELTNTLDPMIEVLDADGEVVAFDSNSAADGRNATLSYTADATATYYVRVVSENDTSGEYLLDSALDPAPRIVGRHLFYNDSAFDGNDLAANADDDNAIATDKAALLPGETAAFANYSSYDKGINGIMIDIEDLADAGSLSTADFEFRVGNNDDPTSWSAAPAPTAVTVRAGQGDNGSDRVTITWADNAIEQAWLEIRVLANGRTGLFEDDVFYFGNAIGETGDSATDAAVDLDDQSATLGSPYYLTGPAPLASAHDFNRDGLVNDDDLVIAQGFVTTPATELVLFTAPGSETPFTLVGDINGDGQIAQADLDFILLNWGDTATGIGTPTHDWWESLGPTIGQAHLDAVLLNWGDSV